MKRLIWVVLFLLTTIGAAGWGSYSWQHSTPVADVRIQASPNSFATPSPALKQEGMASEAAPQVDREQLWQHLEKLTGERYAEDDRQQVRTYLIQQLKSWGFSPVLQPFQGGVNIFAERPGTDLKAGTILVGAHYDTVWNSPGADDNATGMTVVLEVARLLGTRPTPKTLQVIFFDREEAGLLGSLAFTGNSKRLENLRGAIVLDMVGYACRTPECQSYPDGLTIEPLLKSAGVTSPDRGEFIAAVGDAEHLSLLSAFPHPNRPDLPPVVTVPVPLKGLLTPDVLRSDHAPFWYQGVGAVLVTDTANLRSPHYHQPSDTVATLDRPFFTGVAQVVVNATTQLLQN